MKKRKTGSWFDSDFGDNFSSSAMHHTFKVPVGAPSLNSRSSVANRIMSNKPNEQLWIEKHEPRTISELAVHPKKIEEIKYWFVQNASSGDNKVKSVLLLTGPSGCGKTATVRVLAKELKFGIQEWLNPADVTDFVKRSENDYRPTEFVDDLPYVSQSSAFRSFMLRANRYKVLTGLLDSETDSNRPKVVLLEDLPTFAYKRKDEFHDILIQYHKSSRSYPLVIIQSEDSKDDNLRTLFPPELRQALNMVNIQMNGIATTNLVKTLSTMASHESVNSDTKFSVPDKQALAALAASSAGDIRSAVNALQFACLNNHKGNFQTSFEGQTSLGKRKKASGSKVSARKKEESENSSLASIGGKDNNLDLFHAMGKVLYCKREESESTSDIKLLPKNISMNSRRALIINPEELMDNIPMDDAPFISFLHQNYPDFFSSVYDLQNAAEMLSHADLFFKEWTSTGKISLNEYGSSVAIRGLCFSNQQVKGGMGMRNFNKPEWYSVSKVTHQRNSSLIRLGQARGLSLSEMATTFIPVVAKCYGSCLPKDVSDVGLFPGSASLKLKSSSEFLLFNFTKPDEESVVEETEDFLIEDFD